jgi:hypothetical protein
MTLRMVVIAIRSHEHIHGGVGMQELDLRAAQKGNEAWSKSLAPGAHLTIRITNPEAFDKFKLRQEVEVDLTCASIWADSHINAHFTNA